MHGRALSQVGLPLVLTLGIVGVLAACSSGSVEPPSAQPSPTVGQGVVATATPPPIPSPTPQAARRIVGYYTSWSIYQRDFQVADIPADKLTHVNYAFANVDGATGECILGDKWSDDANFRYLGELKEKYPHLKALISVGGWTWSGEFSNVALTEESRRHFVASCIERFLGKRYEGIFDGIDIDWEFPVSGGLARNAARPEDKHNFTLLMEEFRRQLDALSAQTGRQYLLTIAAPAVSSTYANIELKEMSQTLDWLNLMAYDFHGSWDKTTNLHAALYGAADDPEPADLNGDAAVQAYLEAGVPADKIVLGVPFYGRGWAGVPDVDHGLYQPVKGLPKGTWEQGTFDYKDLAKNYVDRNGYVRYWQEEAKGPWLYNAAKGVFIGYDDAESLEVKADYVAEQGLGGVMFWELSADDGTLLGVLYSRLGQ
jgi:chitinase